MDILLFLASAAGFVGMVLFYLLIGIASWAVPIGVIIWLGDRMQALRSRRQPDGS